MSIKKTRRGAVPGAKYESRTLINRHPNNPTWVRVVENLLQDEPQLLLKIAKDPVITAQLEEDWRCTRPQLRKIMHSDCGSAGMKTKGEGSL